MKIFVMVYVIAMVVVGGAFTILAYGEVRYNEGFIKGYKGGLKWVYSAEMTEMNDMDNMDCWWNASWEYRVQDGIFQTLHCTEEQIKEFIENNYTFYDDYEGCYITSVEPTKVNITSAFSLLNYSVCIPLEDICVNCSEDLWLVMDGEAYPCHYYDSPPHYMWDDSPCIILNGNIWIRMDLYKNESESIYFYYGMDENE